MKVKGHPSISNTLKMSTSIRTRSKKATVTQPVEPTFPAKPAKVSVEEKKPKKTQLTKTEFTVTLLNSLKNKHPSLTDDIIREALLETQKTTKEFKLPRNFPKSWGGKQSSDVVPADKPKRPSSSYILFSSAERDRIKGEAKDVAKSDFNKHLSNVWNALKEKNDSLYMKYEKLAQAEKAKYLEEMKAWEEKNPSYKKKDEKDKKTNAFLIFKSQHKGEDIADLRKMWKEMSDQEKKPFQNRAKQENEKFKSDDETSVSSGSKKKANPKENDPDYVLNPDTGKYVKKTGKIGKKLVEKLSSADNEYIDIKNDVDDGDLSDLSEDDDDEDYDE